MIAEHILGIIWAVIVLIGLGAAFYLIRKEATGSNTLETSMRGLEYRRLEDQYEKEKKLLLTSSEGSEQ